MGERKALKPIHGGAELLGGIPTGSFWGPDPKKGRRSVHGRLTHVGGIEEEQQELRSHAEGAWEWKCIWIGEFRCPAAHNAVGLAGESPAVGIDCLST